MTENIAENKDRKLNRFLEILPGLFTWAFMLSPIWLGILWPEVVVWLLTFLSIYWAYLGAKFTIGLTIGYLKYKKELETDWWEKCTELDFSELPDKDTLPEDLDSVKHFVLIAIVNEPYDLLKATIDAIASQTIPTKQITLVFTLEERCADEVKERLDKILHQHKGKFERVLTYVHPAGIPNEAIGVKSANITWGAKHAVADLKAAGENVENYIMTSMDSDHVFSPQFLARVTHLYLTSDKRFNKFYATSVHLFNNNHWDVPSMMRFEANFVTLGTLANRSLEWGIEPHTKDTFACYSVALQTVIDANYWDVTLIDDTVFFWRAFFARDGDFIGVSHYIPYSADAVQGKNYLNSHVSLYKQLLRWGWGVVVVPLSLKGFIKNKKVPFEIKLMWIIKHLKMRVVLINISFLITFGFALLTFANPNVKQTNFAYSLPDAMSLVLTAALVFIVPGSIIRTKISKPMPKDWPVYKKLFAMMEGPLAIINLLTFSFFPFIEAQTRMLLGKRMKDLYHTPKIR